jgi:hypothetical protein
MGFHRTVVNTFFCLLSSLYDKYNFNIVDEPGISTVPSKQIKVLGLNGKRQVGGLSSAEMDVLVTAEIFMSAYGNFVTMMFVFPRAGEKKELVNDAPLGSTAEYYSSGWMQTGIFLKWFHSFIEISKPTEMKPLVLLLDGQESQTEPLELIGSDVKVTLFCCALHHTPSTDRNLLMFPLRFY